jgi:two-component system nitrogen regulation response regulator NtrX
MVVVSRAMETSRLRRENSELRRRRDVTASEMLGSSPAFKTLKAQLEKVTKSNGRVMLTGPAGSGKEMAARFIHSNSNRAGAAFVSVSSAAIEPERMEEVLFGRETSERGVEPGLLEQAHGGVVYFDEVADMPLGTQSKILRVLWNSSSPARAAPTRCASICASFPRPRATCGPKSARAASGRSFTTG